MADFDLAQQVAHLTQQLTALQAEMAARPSTSTALKMQKSSTHSDSKGIVDVDEWLRDLSR